ERFRGDLPEALEKRNLPLQGSAQSARRWEGRQGIHCSYPWITTRGEPDEDRTMPVTVLFPGRTAVEAWNHKISSRGASIWESTIPHQWDDLVVPLTRRRVLDGPPSPAGRGS